MRERLVMFGERVGDDCCWSSCTVMSTASPPGMFKRSLVQGDPGGLYKMM